MRALDFPNNIQIETVSFCNASCGFCPYPETSRTEPQGVMDDAVFDAIVTELSQHPVNLIQPFLNNDPLMDKKLIPRLRQIQRLNPNARLMITTNGALLRPAVIDALAELDLETIHISSNGLTKAVYRETMGLDAFAVLRNVNLLKDRLRRQSARTRVVVTSILMAANAKEVAHMRAYWRGRDVDFYVNPLNDRAGNLPIVGFVEKLPFSSPANRSQLGHMNVSGCASLYSFVAIHWNGDVVGCCNDWRRTRVFGNVREQSLQEIWHGERYREVRAVSDAGHLNDLPLCAECGENRFCVDTSALRDFLARQPTETMDLELVATLDGWRDHEPGTIQLGLVR